MKFRFLFLFFWTYCSMISQTDEIRNAASVAYQAGNYQRSILLFDSLLQQGYKSADIYYNLGNAYWKQGSLPHAVLYYERALKVKPFHKEARFNLGVVQLQQEDDFAIIQDFFLVRWRNHIANQLSADLWAWISLGCLWIGLVAWIGFLFFRHLWNSRMLLTMAIAGLIMAGCGYYYGMVRNQLENSTDQAILMQDESSLHSAPDASSPDLYAIHGGLKVNILDQIDNWIKVQLPNKDEGWIQEAKLTRI